VLASRLEYSPSLPASRDQLWQRYPMGSTVKCLALYPRPFWRDQGLSGEAVCTSGPVSVIFDNTSHDGRQASLLAFVVGDPARSWSTRPEIERREAVLAVMARCFGPAAAAPTHYVEQDWSSEPYSRGCPVGVLAPGALSVGAAPLREPNGRVHWAGTETATEWNGYMEGALQSGERASAEVVVAIRATASGARGAA
jgi:monoamine oxidase